ncbi:MAG TPA: uroporphyrinogen-III C-methyltransferase [Gammaproteobacteria bacterium]
MSETEMSQQAPQEVEVAPIKREPAKNTTGSNRTALIAITIALLVAALTLALWFEVRKLRLQTQAIESQLQANVQALEQREREQRSALSAEARERDTRLAARQEALEQGMQALRDQLGSEHLEWVVAEADYLLRYANRRLLLERDVRGALIALRSTDALLADGANPLYLPVREQLRNEIQSLEALAPLDVDGIALQLGGLSRQLAALPLATARRDIAAALAPETQAATEEGSVVGRFFTAMWNEVKGLVTVRRLDQKVQPLLPPEQRYFLEQNLRLRLEMARLALLRGDAPSYKEDLTAAVAWLDAYYDSSDPAVRQSRDAIAALAKLNIAPALPEIGGSLHTLERIYEKQTGRKPAAALRGSRP